jgi:hypothetical protein
VTVFASTPHLPLRDWAVSVFRSRSRPCRLLVSDGVNPSDPSAGAGVHIPLWRAHSGLRRGVEIRDGFVVRSPPVAEQNRCEGLLRIREGSGSLLPSAAGGRMSSRLRMAQCLGIQLPIRRGRTARVGAPGWCTIAECETRVKKFET